MGARSELFTTQIFLENRSYFFNVKENRNGDVFLQIVESKNRDGSDFDRHQIAVFEEDMKNFLQGLDRSLSFIEKERKERVKKQAARDAKFSARAPDSPARVISVQGKIDYGKKVEEMRQKEREEWREIRHADGIKRTGKVIRVVSKKSSGDDAGLETNT